MADNKINILLIKKDVKYFRLIENMLSDIKDYYPVSYNYNLINVKNISVSFEIINKKKIDIILLDISLLIEQEIKTFKQIIFQYPSIAIILLIKEKDTNLTKEILQAGASDYLVKGQFNQTLLLHFLRYYYEKKQLTEKLKFSKLQTKIILNNNLDCIAILDKKGIICYVNQAFLKMFNKNKKELIGNNFGLPIITKESTEVNIIKSDGAIVQSNMHIVNTEWNSKPAYMATIRDITDTKEAKKRSKETIELKELNSIIQDKNKKITDSINYARHIQRAIIPSFKEIRQLFKQAFVYYKPKDVVSGDFPWYYKNGEDIYIAVVDCTGHGVPGAMLSMIGHFLLNRIIINYNIKSPDDILKKLDDDVRNSLSYHTDGYNLQDGMDIALCKINFTKNEVVFSGARRPLYHVNKGNLTEYKGTKITIGGINQNHIKFKNYRINVQPEDSIYFFTDGLSDQFGGPNGTKLTPNGIKDIIIKNHNLTMDKMYFIFKNFFEEWKGNFKQIDDFILMGIKF